jgi:hypothetical protein
MAGDVAFVKGLLKFQLEFVDVDPMDLGVQARFEVEYSGRSQNLKWTAAHLWFEYEALVRFETELRDGYHARLLDMSRYEVLHFEQQSSQEYLTINPPSQSQSQDGDCIAIRLKIDSGSMRELYETFNQFGKWW